jgi:metal-responsive CopG/Arc/MetJ family transcriptional regulator
MSKRGIIVGYLEIVIHTRNEAAAAKVVGHQAEHEVAVCVFSHVILSH